MTLSPCSQSLCKGIHSEKGEGDKPDNRSIIKRQVNRLFRGTQEKGSEEGAGRFLQRCFLKQVRAKS